MIPTIQTECLDEKRTGNGNKKWMVRRILWIFMWIVCFCACSTFLVSLYEEYKEEKPLTIVTLINAPENPEPVIVKICNSVFFDEEVILNYNGSDLNEADFQFLFQAASFNSSVDYNKWVWSTPLRDTFMLRYEMLNRFKLDIDKFLLTCFVSGTFMDCAKSFHFYSDLGMSCFQAKIELHGYGINRALMMGLYFDPVFKFGKYSAGAGAYVTFQHPLDYMGALDGVFVEPNDYLLVSGTTEYRTQSKPFRKANCIKRKSQNLSDLSWNTSPIPYHPETCIQICYQEAFQQVCNCSSFYVLNGTEDDCLKKEETRICLSRTLSAIKFYETMSKSCVSKCLANCEQTKIRTSVLREHNKFSPAKLLALLDDFRAHVGNYSYLASRLVTQLATSENPLAAAEAMLPNIAHVTFLLKNEQQQLMFEIIPFMNFSTFISNVGGLVGLWLGLSVVSVLGVIEEVVSCICRRQWLGKNFGIAPHI